MNLIAYPPTPEYITLGQFGNVQRTAGSPLARLRTGVLDSKGGSYAMRRKVPPGQHLREIPQARARPAAKSIRHYAREYADRDSAIAAAYASGAHTMKGIGDYFGLHCSRVSKIVGNAERPMRAKRKLRGRRSVWVSGN